MDDEQARRADRVGRLIEFVNRHAVDVGHVPPWQEDFLQTLFGVPIIESRYVPDGELYLINWPKLDGPTQYVLIQTATPVVPYGQWMCEKGSHGSLRLGACPFCGAQT